MAATWRCLFQVVDGSGVEQPLAEVTLHDVRVTRKLSTPPQISASVPQEVAQLEDEHGEPIFQEWATAVYVETPMRNLRGGLLVDSKFSGAKWDLDIAGFSYYPKGQPYVWDETYNNVDPTDMFRMIWERLQGLPAGNLNVTVDDVTTPVRIGGIPVQVQATGPDVDAAVILRDKLRTTDGVFEDWTWIGCPTVVSENHTLLQKAYGGNVLDRVAAANWLDAYANRMVDGLSGDPYVLNYFATLDLGTELDNLAKNAPFEWEEQHYWDDTVVRHHIAIGYPRLGRRRTDLRFAIGENIQVVPDTEHSGDDFATDVLVLGVGEGRDRVAGSQSLGTSTRRLRRVVVVDDKNVTDVDAARTRAGEELMVRGGTLVINSVEVQDHPNAPVENIDLGDEIYLEGWTGKFRLNHWVRITAITEDISKGGGYSLAVIPADTLGAP